MEWFWGALVALIVVIAVSWQPMRQRWRQRNTRKAIDLFRLRRESLEAKFFDLAAASGKPRGLRWVECDWQEDVRFARDLETGLLTAFVSVELHFEAIEGGDMEEVAAVGDVRDASAVFHYDRGQWGTGGKALFNMNPNDAVGRLMGQFEEIPC